MMTKKERAINLANALLFEWDTKTNQNTAAIRFVNSEHYEIFSEAVENGWISDRFHFNEGLMMDGVRIEKKD